MFSILPGLFIKQHLHTVFKILYHSLVESKSSKHLLFNWNDYLQVGIQLRLNNLFSIMFERMNILDE